MYQIIDGKAVSSQIKDEIRVKVEQLVRSGKRRPGLAVILVGSDPASQVYVKNKITGCENVGFYSKVLRLPENTAQEELLSIIADLNKDNDIDGILVQKPLPRQIESSAVDLAILPDKDVDCFHPENYGKMVQGIATVKPCTPAGIIELLKRYDIGISGKKAVVLGRSNIVGKPVAELLLQENATVTICHSKTQNLAKIAAEADILVAAIGKANFVTTDMVKEGSVIIDVGINRVEGKLYGDVHFEKVKDKAAYITPVPGGVGPMTIAMLLQNTLQSALLHI